MKTIYTIGDDQRTLIAKRTFSAPLERVWAAWTNAESLEQWWAPKPWCARTKSFNFSPDGTWLYVIEGPNGETHWSKTTYLVITPLAAFSGLDSFCDEAGTINPDLPTSHVEVQFDTEGNTTEVLITTTYANNADLKTVLDMGVKEGFNQGLDQLEELLERGT